MNRTLKGEAARRFQKPAAARIEGGPVAYPFVESPNVTKTGGRTIDLIVIHTMEMDEKGDTAEHCALWFKNPAAKVSAHYCVDRVW